MRFVIDASAAAEYLLRTSLGLKVSELIERAELAAPELLDVEILSVLRRAVLKKRLEENRALLAIEDLAGWDVERISHTVLIHDAWRYRHNTSAYDAFYVSAAHIYDAPLLTTEGPLSKAPGLGIVVQNIRLAK
ncbi:MAG TPA: type II toxin-antitoxin system VapC family toxin [Thermodesulfobacteriota bacterium]|nr:type II toxin-antitoxin system VapC family toxin [Thermodesulfobacteriota bacterium]